MQRDTVIGIVGVVILVAAMVGVFTYERGQASSLTGAGGVTQNLTGPPASGTVALGETDDKTIVINQTGLTNITFTLTWTPGQGTDTLKLVAAPGNDTGFTSGFESQAEDDGSITLVVPIGNTAQSGVIGVGSWQISVEFVSAAPGGIGPVPPVVTPPGSTDTSVAYAVDTSLQALGGSN